MRYQGYLNRALKSSDPRYLQIFTRMGYGVAAPSSPPYVPAPLPDPPPPIEDDDDDDDEPGGPPDNHGQQLKAAREEYERVTGKKPFNGWDVAELHKRIADYKKANK